MTENFATLAQAFESRAQKYGVRTFLKDKSNKTWQDHSWAAIADAAARLRAGLQKIGRSRRSPQNSHPGASAPGCGIPPRYQAAFRAGTAFAAISLPSSVKRLWISDVTVANSSARVRSLSTN